MNPNVFYALGKKESAYKMPPYYFSKAKLEWQTVIIVFEQGQLGKPVCILQPEDIKKLNEEWNKKTDRK